MRSRRAERNAGAVGRFLLPLVLVSASAAQAAEVERIVVGADAPPAVRYAAEELQRFYGRAADNEPRIVPPTESDDAPQGTVYVGPAAVSGSPLVLDRDGLGPEDLRIRSDGRAVAIVGGGPRGTLYGVYEWLERALGVRFLTPGHTHVPPLGEKNPLRGVELTYRPPLEYRKSHYGIAQHHPAFAARLRINAIPKKDKYGGRTPMRLINHSMTRWITTGRYGREYPEYFALVDGERINEADTDTYETQPCFTEPAVRRIVKRGVLRQLEKQPGRANISVAQNDSDVYCRCADCRKLIEKHGSPMGPLLDLVNEVAAAVAEEHPGVQVGTLAYRWSRQPPENIEPRDNVQVQLASIEACMLHPISEANCPQNAAFREDLAGWSELTDQIYIWNYNTNFRNYLLPCPNLRSIGPNVRYFVDRGAKGLFMQAAGGANVAEFDGLRNYLISNMIWDPSHDPRALIHRFIDLHYAEAAEPIRRWIELIHDNAQQRRLHHNCFGTAADYGITPKVVARGRELFDRALERAESDRVRKRVLRASLCVERAEMEPAVLAMRGQHEWTESLQDRMRPKVRRFYELAERFNVNIPVEHHRLADEQRRMRKLFGLKRDEAW